MLAMKTALASVALWLWATGLPAQDARPLAVGDVAPDFALTGATAAGVLDTPVRLGDFRDQTLVIAFFYQARTKG